MSTLSPDQFHEHESIGGSGWAVSSVERRPRSSSQVNQKRTNTDIARQTQMSQADAETNGNLYHPSFKGRRDPMTHFFSARFNHKLASEELSHWWHSTGQQSIPQERAERQQ